MAVAQSRISIIVPAFNEAAAIGQVAGGLRARFPEAELFVVDDGSTDSTAALARAAGVCVLSHDTQRGYGAALRTGVEAARGEFVLFCDGDGQHSLEDVGRLMEACDGDDMIVGARTADSHFPLQRRPGKWVLEKFANFLAGRRIPDLNSGLRMFRRETLLRYIHLMPQGFSFSTTSTMAMLKTNRRIKYIPITVTRRLGSSTVRQWRDGPRTLMLMLRLSVLFEPLKVFMSVAGIFFLLAAASLAANLIWGQRKVSATTVLFAVAAVVVFMGGLLCDQVSAIRREKHE